MATAAQRLVTEDALAKNRFIPGAGTPNGKVTAHPGSIYADSSKAWDVAAWIKTAGTGNTGWEPLVVTAAVRSVIALSTTPVAGGNVKYSRGIGSATLIIDGIKPMADGTLTLFTDRVLTSICPTPGGSVEFRVGNGNSELTRRAKFDQYGTLTIYGAKATDLLFGSVHYSTNRAWTEPLGTVVVA